MDPIKIEAMNNYCNKRMHQSSLKNTKTRSSSNAFIVYILTALTCSLVFFSPFWYPSFESLINSLPNLIKLFLSPMWLFIVGNLIVFVLVGESKLLTSEQAPGEVYYSEYVSRSQSLKQQRPVISDHNECKKVCEVTRSAGRSKSIRKAELAGVCTKGSVMRNLSAEELSRRADDFIARVNRQRRLEATDLVQWGM